MQLVVASDQTSCSLSAPVNGGKRISNSHVGYILIAQQSTASSTLPG